MTINRLLTDFLNYGQRGNFSLKDENGSNLVKTPDHLFIDLISVKHHTQYFSYTTTASIIQYPRENPSPSRPSHLQQEESSKELNLNSDCPHW